MCKRDADVSVALCGAVFSHAPAPSVDGVSAHDGDGRGADIGFFRRRIGDDFGEYGEVAAATENDVVDGVEIHCAADKRQFLIAFDFVRFHLFEIEDGLSILRDGIAAASDPIDDGSRIERNIGNDVERRHIDEAGRGGDPSPRSIG